MDMAKGGLTGPGQKLGCLKRARDEAWEPCEGSDVKGALSVSG